MNGHDHTLDLAAAEELTESLTRQYRFFHWHVEFPHIFRVGNGVTNVDSQTGWSGGFTCVIGNPPWEKVKVQEKEFFAPSAPRIAMAPTAAVRRTLIENLATSERKVDRKLFQDYRDELRKMDGWGHILRNSGRYPLAGRGDINTYAVFAESDRTITSAHGRTGVIVKTGASCPSRPS